jgi:hypothetical protein
MRRTTTFAASAEWKQQSWPGNCVNIEFVAACAVVSRETWVQAIADDWIPRAGCGHAGTDQKRCILRRNIGDSGKKQQENSKKDRLWVQSAGVRYVPAGRSAMVNS